MAPAEAGAIRFFRRMRSRAIESAKTNPLNAGNTRVFCIRATVMRAESDRDGPERSAESNPAIGCHFWAESAKTNPLNARICSVFWDVGYRHDVDKGGVPPTRHTLGSQGRLAYRISLATSAGVFAGIRTKSSPSFRSAKNPAGSSWKWKGLRFAIEGAAAFFPQAVERAKLREHRLQRVESIGASVFHSSIT